MVAAAASTSKFYAWELGPLATLVSSRVPHTARERARLRLVARKGVYGSIMRWVAVQVCSEVSPGAAFCLLPHVIIRCQSSLSSSDPGPL
jgi:hypothetical protein